MVLSNKVKPFKYQYLFDSQYTGTEHYAILQPTQFVPKNVISFGEYSFKKASKDYSLDFFIDDYKFERIWNDCDKYINYLSKFYCIITTDFSAYRDAPLWERKYNIGRNRAIAYYLQNKGISIIPVASWAYIEDFEWCLDGLPKHSSIAISTNGSVRNFISHSIFIEGVKILQERLNPSHLIICGGPVPELDEQYDNIIYYPNFSQRTNERRKKNG
jgi:hypothetical protein